MKKAFFLDRDGTINVDHGYVHEFASWEFTEGALEALRLINLHDYLAIVVTNQSGIGRGMYGEADLLLLHSKVDSVLAMHGVRIDAYYYCPHLPDDGCDCRKPRLGMYRKAIADFDIDAAQSITIGDKPSDVERVHELGISKRALVGLEWENCGIIRFSRMYDAVVHWISINNT